MINSAKKITELVSLSFFHGLFQRSPNRCAQPTDASQPLLSMTEDCKEVSGPIESLRNIEVLHTAKCNTGSQVPFLKLYPLTGKDPTGVKWCHLHAEISTLPSTPRGEDTHLAKYQLARHIAKQDQHQLKSEQQQQKKIPMAKILPQISSQMV